MNTEHSGTISAGQNSFLATFSYQLAAAAPAGEAEAPAAELAM